MYKISIVIPCFNKFNFTKSCLNDLKSLPQETHEIIIIDNASSDETNKELKNSNIDNLIYIRNEENLFHSKACNQGFNIATGNYIIFLNNDIRVNASYSTWTENLIKFSDIGIVGPTMGVLNSKLDFVKEANANLSGNSYLSGWCLSSSKDNWKKLDTNNSGQVFNERYPFYFNDVDLSMRCREIDIPINVVDIPVVHFGKISAKQLNIQKLYLDSRKIFLEDWKKLIK